MKKKGKGKKIAIIIISVILALVILVPVGLFTFFFRISPLFMDGEEIKAAYIDNPAMYTSWQEYDKQNLTFSGETKVFSEESFEITLPEAFKINEKATGDGMYTYLIENGDETFGYVMISIPLFAEADLEDPEIKEEIKNNEALVLFDKIVYGPAAKKVYGINLGTYYDNELLINSMTMDDFDTENHNQVFLFTMYGIKKSMSGIGDLTKNREIYKLDTDTYKGFIYNRSKVAENEDEKSYDMYSMNIYSLDNLNYPYTIFINARDNVLTEDDIFAILNSFKVK